MKTAPIHSIIAASFLALVLSLTAPAAHAVPTPAEEMMKYPSLDRAVEKAQVMNGWNMIATMPETSDVLWAQALDGQIIRWQVRTAEGKPMPTSIALSKNPSNLRIMWAPENRPYQYIEGPAWVIQPDTVPDF